MDREAFQTKQRVNFRPGPNRRGRQKIKKSQVPVHLMRTQKHKILSLVVLNMAKYTIISLILIAFVPILFIFNLFQNVLGGNSTFKNPKSQVDFKGGGVIFTLDPVQDQSLNRVF